MKKILVITPFFAPHVGGSQQYMEDLYAQLIKDHPGMQVDVLCYNTNHAEREEDYRGMHVYRIPGISLLPGQFALPNPFLLGHFLWKQRASYGLLHVSTRFFETAWWAPLYARLTKTPIFLTDHCAYHPVHANSLIRFIAKQIDILFIPHVLRMYDRVFATNQATQVFLKHSLHTDSHVLYGGVNTALFTPRGDVRVHKRIHVLYIGRMIPSKGVEMLFSVAKRHPEYDFTFAGPGELVEFLQKQTAALHLNHVSILGSQNKGQVVTLLKQADMFVHPSYHHEGFPNILLEAGAMGVPTIATDAGGTREIILNGKTGLLLPMKDETALEEAITHMAKNEELRKTVGRNLSLHIHKNFSWEKISEEQFRILKEVI